jgi:hypothetical protein
MSKKFYFFLISTISIFEGVLGLIYGKILLRHWHNTSIVESLVWIVSGLIFFYLGLNSLDKKNYTICPKCKESFNYSDLENGKCLYCENIDTIDIEEYYKDKGIP